MKKQTVLFLAAGALCCLGAVVLLICCIINGGNFLHYGSLVLALLGGGVILWMALRQRKLYRQAAAPAAGKKPAVAVLSPLAEKATGLTARMLALLILTLACVAFFFLYGTAQQTESIPQSTVQTGLVYERGKVIAIDESTYQGQQDVEDVPVGKQIVQVELTDGERFEARVGDSDDEGVDLLVKGEATRFPYDEIVKAVVQIELNRKDV